MSKRRCCKGKAPCCFHQRRRHGPGIPHGRLRTRAGQQEGQHPPPVRDERVGHELNLSSFKDKAQNRINSQQNYITQGTSFNSGMNTLGTILGIGGAASGPMTSMTNTTVIRTSPLPPARREDKPWHSKAGPLSPPSGRTSKGPRPSIPASGPPASTVIPRPALPTSTGTGPWGPVWRFWPAPCPPGQLPGPGAGTHQ